MNENTKIDESRVDDWIYQEILSDTLASLVGGYFNLAFAEEEKEEPNKKNIEKWEMRKREIMMISDGLFVSEKTYEEVQELTAIYSKEDKEVDKLRGI